MFRFLDNAAVVQQLRRNFLVCLKALVQAPQTNFQPAFLEDVGETALRQATMQRHLAALKTDLGGIAGARFLALLTAASGFTQT